MEVSLGSCCRLLTQGEVKAKLQYEGSKFEELSIRYWGQSDVLSNLSGSCSARTSDPSFGS